MKSTSDEIATGAPVAGTPILKSTETRALFPGIRKRPSIRRRRSSVLHSCGPTMEFVGFLLGIFVVMGLNLYIWDLRGGDAEGGGAMHRSLRASLHFPGTDSAWMQQTLSKHSMGLRKLRREEEEEAEREQDGNVELGDNLAASMDIP